MHIIKRLVAVLLLAILLTPTFAQKPHKPNAAELKLALKKLNVLGSALYVAAHPDDENTRMITYLANEELVNTAYLSMTRGDGGQNLIGPQIRELLGIIRTQELLAARRVDGGQQFFTRANDFGYSKSPEETVQIWDKEQVLSDVVWAIRKFRPDVIITRFPTDGRGGHGHHTTSAILAGEAFDLVGDKTKFPDQLAYVDVWQPKRLLLNTGRWWNSSINENTPGVVTVDVGKYNTLLGKSYTEIASESRSQHKSQGFGSTGRRGQAKEFLEYTAGDRAQNGLFDGINLTWTRIEGGDKVQPLVEQAISNFDLEQPAKSVAELVKIRKMIQTIPDDGYWKEKKTVEVDQLIKGCMALYLEVSASDYYATPGGAIEFNHELINRSDVAVKVLGLKVAQVNMDSALNMSLENNIPVRFKQKVALPKNIEYTQHYWLSEPGTLGMYEVKDRLNIGKAENDPAMNVEYLLEIEGERITYKMPLIYKWNDPVGGELYRPFEVTPPVFSNISEDVYIFAANDPKPIRVTVKAGKANLKGNVQLDLPKGWKSNPVTAAFDLTLKGEEQLIEFSVLPPKKQESAEVGVIASVDGEKYQNSLVSIEYDHIPIQTLFPKASAKLVKLNIEKRGNVIGYIQGAGDKIPESLRNIGYEVWEMKDDEITPENLQNLDAVILGVRVLNTQDRAKFYMKDLLSYAENGGTLIVQYNTNFRLKTNEFAPYDIKLSRDRVTVEEAEVRILKPNHPVINGPNKITEKDFDGWVQERGLYFPNDWSQEYEAILSSNDPGEDAKDGGLLVAKYGKGYYVYTGYSWFRELPAGVPGAFRIFTNLISLGNEENKKPQNTNLSNYR
ncbi:MAG: PIG-L family deacetylase [Bacteroidota bacterium]